MTSIREAIARMLSSPPPPAAGVYTAAAETQEGRPYRLHLRLEEDGNGILILDAATVLHLNPTAAEYAYHFLLGHNPEETAADITRRYRISRQQALADYARFQERIHTLLETPDLAPDLYLETAGEETFAALSAPLRLDCALTYRLPEGVPAEYAPQRRVERELSTAEWEAILDKAWKVGIPHAVFTGGEPTLREDLPALIARAEANGQVTGLCSLGLRLGETAYRRTLLETGLDHLLFLLRPNDPASWGALEAILPEDLFTTVHLTLTPENAPQAESHLRRLAELGANALSLSAADPALYPALAPLQDLSADLGLELKWGLPVPYGEANPVALEESAAGEPRPPSCACLYLEPDGDALPVQGLNRVLGNFLRDDWEAIWQRAAAR